LTFAFAQSNLRMGKEESSINRYSGKLEPILKPVVVVMRFVSENNMKQEQ